MPSRADVVAVAREWVGTPYHHEGRQRGASCDCIGLIIGIARTLNAPCPRDADLPRYGPWPSDHIAERTASALMDLASDQSMAGVKVGQVGLFWIRDKGHGQHFAVFANCSGRRTMIHAYISSKAVIEAGMSNFWRRRLMRVYNFRGVVS